MLDGRGFTLVEMAVVLVIVGMLILTVFPALTALRATTQRSATQSNLQALMSATAAYVQANGCLPCPTPANTTGAGFGHVRGDTGLACGACNVALGIPPYVSLGIAPNIAHDGWGHWFTMGVDKILTTTTVVPPTSQCSSADFPPNPVTPSCTQLNASQKGLCQPKYSSTTSTSAVPIAIPNGPTQYAAVIFVSHGSKGYGAYLASASVAETRDNGGCRLTFPTVASGCPQQLTCNIGGDGLALSECNATGQNTYVNASAQDNYDDMMAYASRDVIVSMFNNGACN